MNASIYVDGRHPGTTISRYIYGHFSEHLGRCIYGGLYVGKDSPIPNVNGMRTAAVEALRRIHVPVLRWPGGCFADEYHWRDGIGPNRKRMVNTHWGGDVEDNSFGTHEFMELCRQIGCEPYINGNVGSGTVQEMSEWIEYMNSAGDSTVAMERWANGAKEPFGVRFFGIGNESWGCGGNMKAEAYADLYRRFQTYCRNYSGHKLYKIACGSNGEDMRWTEVLMREAGSLMDGISLHWYTVPTNDWKDKGYALDFDRPLYDSALKNAAHIGDLIDGHSAIMDRYDPKRRVGLIVDEWGTWHNVEPGTNPGYLYQQNTMRDAMVAALSLNIFNARASRVAMTNIAQTVNVLQSLLLTEGDQVVLTPTYHVFDLYQAHMDAQLLESAVFCGKMDNGLKQLSVSASRKEDQVTVTAANLDPEQPAEVLLHADGCEGWQVSGRVLSGEMHAHNSFEAPEAVRPAQLNDISATAQGLSFTLPPCSVAAITLHA